MAEITELKKHIINYSKTKEIYSAYRESGYSAKFNSDNSHDIMLHQHAKQAFNLLSHKQIPTMKSLQLEYQECLTMKNLLMKKYKSIKSIMNQSVVIKNNVDLILRASVAKDGKTERILEK